MIVHKVVEHERTLIKDGVNARFVDQKGAPHLNTFLVYVPTIVVTAGFTRDNLGAGVCFIGRPYDDGNLIKFNYADEQATYYRRPPASTTGLCKSKGKSKKVKVKELEVVGREYKRARLLFSFSLSFVCTQSQ